RNAREMSEAIDHRLPVPDLARQLELLPAGSFRLVDPAELELAVGDVRKHVLTPPGEADLRAHLLACPVQLDRPLEVPLPLHDEAESADGLGLAAYRAESTKTFDALLQQLSRPLGLSEHERVDP